MTYCFLIVPKEGFCVAFELKGPVANSVDGSCHDVKKLFFLFVSLVIFHHLIDVQSVVLKYKMIQNFQKIELEDVSYFFRVISHAL